MKYITSRLNPPPRFFERAYLFILIFFIGRAFKTAYRIDPYIRNEVDNCSSLFSLKLEISDKGPSFLAQAQTKKNLEIKPTVTLKIRSIAAAIRIFTFQENSCLAEGQSRFIPDGHFDIICTFIRILDELEILLLPRFIAKHAVLRYESPKRKHWIRARLYLGIILGF